MAEADNNDIFDDLDAFFSAADNSDAGALEKAAESVANVNPTGKHPSVTGSHAAATTTTATGFHPRATPSQPPTASDVTDTALANAFGFGGDDAEDMEGKFIAIDPDSIANNTSQDPFILVPAHVHTLIPWYVWVSIAIGLVVMVAGVVLTPRLALNRLTARLEDNNPANAQSVMRQLVIKGDEQTIGKLYDMAASPANGMAARLRAVDTLSLISAPDAERALLRLELASGTDAQVREAAIAARRQREAAKTRNRPR